MTWVGDDATPYLKVGDAMNGANIFYTQCTAGTIKIDSVTMMTLGTSAATQPTRWGTVKALYR
jgi:hypothetical protein